MLGPGETIIDLRTLRRRAREFARYLYEVHGPEEASRALRRRLPEWIAPVLAPRTPEQRMFEERLPGTAAVDRVRVTQLAMKPAHAAMKHLLETAAAAGEEVAGA